MVEANVTISIAQHACELTCVFVWADRGHCHVEVSLCNLLFGSQDLLLFFYTVKPLFITSGKSMSVSVFLGSCYDNIRFSGSCSFHLFSPLL